MRGSRLGVRGTYWSWFGGGGCLLPRCADASRAQRLSGRDCRSEGLGRGVPRVDALGGDLDGRALVGDALPDPWRDGGLGFLPRSEDAAGVQCLAGGDQGGEGLERGALGLDLGDGYLERCALVGGRVWSSYSVSSSVLTDGGPVPWESACSMASIARCLSTSSAKKKWKSTGWMLPGEI